MLKWRLQCQRVDTDGDGLQDGADNGAENFNINQADGDGTGGVCDKCPDDPDMIEPGDCGFGAADDDADGDLIRDCQDNCPNDANDDQADADGDGVGDACTIAPPAAGTCGAIGASITGVSAAALAMISADRRIRRRSRRWVMWRQRSRTPTARAAKSHRTALCAGDAQRSESFIWRQAARRGPVPRRGTSPCPAE